MKKPIFESVVAFSTAGSRTCRAVERAVEIAERSNGTVTVITAIETVPDWILGDSQVQGWVDDYFEDTRESIRVLVDLYRHRVSKIEGRILRGRADTSLSKYISENQPDLLVKELGDDPTDKEPSSLDFRLLRKCPCSVLLLHPDSYDDGVAIAIDPTEMTDNERSTRDFVSAAAMVVRNDSDNVSVIQVLSTKRFSFLNDAAKERHLKQLIESRQSEAHASLVQIGQESGIELNPENIHLLQGRASDLVIEYVRDNRIGTLVLGCTVQSGVRGHLLGRTAERIISNVCADTLTIKSKKS